MATITVNFESEKLVDLVNTLRDVADTLEAQIPTDLPPKRYALIIFDMNGTLTNTPFIDHGPLRLLPGRKEHLAALRADYRSRGWGHRGAASPHYAIASNQGGVAFGFATEDEATAEVAGIAEQIDTSLFAVSFGHPSPKYGYERYGTPEMLARRKPAAGMLLELLRRCQVTPESTLMVGDMMEDQKAARAAGVDFMWAREFFPPVQQAPAAEEPETDPFLPD